MQSESTDSNFNYEITVDYNCWLKTIDQVSAPTGDIPVVHIPSPTEPIIPSKSDIKHEPDESPTTDNCITADSHQPDAGGTENQLTSTEPSTAFSCYNHNFKDKYSYIAQENRYYCDLCLDSFKTVRDIETHLHTRCQSTKAIRYVCTECNVEFKNANLHRHHMQVLHPDSAVAQTIRDNSRLICDYCGRIFKLRNELRRHMYKHNGLPRPFVCRVCDRGFVHASSYAGHLRMHSGDKPYKCSAPNCQQSFTTNSGLYIHHLTVHADKEQYKHQCEFCQKRFSVKNRLTFVMMLICILFEWWHFQPFFFFAFSLPNRDHRRMHTGERPYQCNYCANTYKTKKDRRRHHRTHNGERPHKCDACNKVKWMDGFYFGLIIKFVVFLCRLLYGKTTWKCIHWDVWWPKRIGMKLPFQVIYNYVQYLSVRICELRDNAWFEIWTNKKKQINHKHF